MIAFSCISPHAPILLPNTGSVKDRKKVKKTIESLELLGNTIKEVNPDKIIISSPHPDWGFHVPLFFLAKDFKGDIETFLIGTESPKFYFEKGESIYQNEKYKIQDTPKQSLRDATGQTKYKVAIIASGDLSHCLKEDGPYGFHPDGPKFDKAFIESLKKKYRETILNLDEMFPEAAECGLRSFCFLLGILEAHSTNSGQIWQPEILSYEEPFGVGYLTAKFNFS